MIRPATPLMACAADRNPLLNNQSTNDLNTFVPPLDIVSLSATALRHNMRSRSNSEPVTFIGEQTNRKVCNSTAMVMTKPRSKTPCKARRVVTPHARKAATIARRTKLRSKSESLPEMNPFQPVDELQIPSYCRSDSSVSAHEAVLPISSTGSIGQESFEWPATIISASGHHSTSLSSDEQAIDNDILSVLANCDAEDTGDSSVLKLREGPPSTSSYHSSTRYGEVEDTGMLPVGMECFEIAENATIPAQISQELVMTEPEAELGSTAFATLSEDWSNALLLSDHLKKMSMAQEDTPPRSLVSTFGRMMPSEGTKGKLCSASHPVHTADLIPLELTPCSPVPLDTFSVKTTSQLSGDNELVGLHSTNFQQRCGVSCTSEAAKMEDGGVQQMLWLSGEVGVETVSNSQPSSEALDQLLQHDDTLEWKPSDVFEGDEEVGFALADTGMTPALL